MVEEAYEPIAEYIERHPDGIPPGTKIVMHPDLLALICEYLSLPYQEYQKRKDDGHFDTARRALADLNMWESSRKQYDATHP